MKFASLHPYGWTASHEARFAAHAGRGLVPARVARADANRWLVFTGESDAPVPAVAAGRLRHEAAAAADLPAVGDWVAVAPGDPLVVHAVLPRGSTFRRLAPGRETLEQVVAANVDVVFLVAGLDGDFNPRRIERYVAAVWESGAQPVVVLNKADLPDQDAVTERVAEVEAVAIGVPVVALSAREGAGLEALAPHLVPGRTVALVGSSGVGKSTLVNALLGEERQDTGEVRADDSRGRHTTTHRELILLPGDVLLLDTPGMREFARWSDGGDAALGSAFPEIEALAASCRFGDCAHEAEPGCAVQAALAGGTLDAARHASWLKLRREERAFAVRHDRRLQKAERAKWKAISKSADIRMKAKYGRR
jgi:ribosome biogenesis GTPase